MGGQLWQQCFGSLKNLVMGVASSELKAKGWWGHLNNKRIIQGNTKAIQLWEKYKDYESSISSKQHVVPDQEI